MKKVYFLLFVVLLSACSAPYDKVVKAVSNSLEVSTHIVAARTVGPDEGTAFGYCESWINSNPFARCDRISQSFTDSEIGSIDNPTDIPIVKWTIGEIQLHGAKVVNSYGLDWFDPNGNPVDPASFQEGVFYTFKRNDNPAAGFQLVTP